MSWYDYKGVNSEEQPVEGRIEANMIGEAIDLLKNKGLKKLEVTTSKTKGPNPAEVDPKLAQTLAQAEKDTSLANRSQGALGDLIFDPKLLIGGEPNGLETKIEKTQSSDPPEKADPPDKADAKSQIDQAVEQAEKNTSIENRSKGVMKQDLLFEFKFFDPIVHYVLQVFRQRSIWTTKERIVFFRQLDCLVSKSFTLPKGLEVIAREKSNPALAAKISELYESIINQTPLPEVTREGAPQGMIAQHFLASKLFSPQQIAMVDAAEMSAGFDNIFHVLACDEQDRLDFKKRIDEMLLPPKMVAAVIWLGAPILGYAFATVSLNFAQMVPQSASLHSLCNLLVHPLTLAIEWLLPPILLWLLNRVLQTESTKEKLSSFLMRLPIIGPPLNQIQVAIFLKTLGQTLNSGLKLEPSLEVSGRVALPGVAQSVLKGIREGQPLQYGFDHPQIPPLAYQMVRTGEETGKLADMLIHAAKIFEEESSHRLENLTQLIEPIFMALIGIVVGGVCFISISPMLELIQSL